MIDIENELYTSLRASILATYTSCVVTGEYPDIVSSLPCVYIAETDNSSDNKYANVTYTMEIYSKTKTQAKGIRDVIDSVMSLKGFQRVSINVVPNYMDNTIYRIIMRYQAKADASGTIYQR